MSWPRLCHQRDFGNLQSFPIQQSQSKPAHCAAATAHPLYFETCRGLAPRPPKRRRPSLGYCSVALLGRGPVSRWLFRRLPAVAGPSLPVLTVDRRSAAEHRWP